MYDIKKGMNSPGIRRKERDTNEGGEDGEDKASPSEGGESSSGDDKHNRMGSFLRGRKSPKLKENKSPRLSKKEQKEKKEKEKREQKEREKEQRDSQFAASDEECFVPELIEPLHAHGDSEAAFERKKSDPTLDPAALLEIQKKRKSMSRSSPILPSLVSASEETGDFTSLQQPTEEEDSMRYDKDLNGTEQLNAGSRFLSRSVEDDSKSLKNRSPPPNGLGGLKSIRKGKGFSLRLEKIVGRSRGNSSSSLAPAPLSERKHFRIGAEGGEQEEQEERELYSEYTPEISPRRRGESSPAKKANSPVSVLAAAAAKVESAAREAAGKALNIKMGTGGEGERDMEKAREKAEEKEKERGKEREKERKRKRKRKRERKRKRKKKRKRKRKRKR